MRRCRANGLTTDDDGWTVDPAVVRHRLENLARWKGDLRDGLFPFALAFAVDDVASLFDALEWRHAYVSRYMGIPLAEIEAMPMRTLRRYMKHLGDIVKKENGAPSGEKRYL